jgi:ubiquinone/menaquinone biosynthesis C-methylase UbiE
MNDAQERLDTRISADRLQVALHNQRYEFVLKNLTQLESVLEVGTGEGNLSVLLASRCGKYVGLEIDPEACRIASERLGTRGTVRTGDARNLPFDQQTFSGIVCLEVLEHLGDFQAGIREIHRCLRTDGMAILSVPFRRRGGLNPSNRFHLYEPGEKELVQALKTHFGAVRVLYQYFEENVVMKLARIFHLRRILGIDRIYRDLTQGEPRALARLKINPDSSGKNLHLIVIVEAPRA